MKTMTLVLVHDIQEEHMFINSSDLFATFRYRCTSFYYASFYCFTDFAGLSFNAYIFKISMCAWWVDSFTVMSHALLSLVISFVLINLSFNINIITPAFLCLMFT